MSPEKDLEKLRKAALAQGWRIKSAKRTTHEKWYSPDGSTIVTVASNSTISHSFKNVLSQLRRAGLKGI